MNVSDALLVDRLFGSWWLLVNYLIVTLAWRSSQIMFPLDRWDTRLLHTAVLYLANIIGLTTLLGCIGLLSGANLLVLASIEIAIGEFWLRRRFQFRGLPPNRIIRFERLRWEWLWIVAGSMLFAHIVLHGLMRFPAEFDSLAYHIPLIDHWLQQGNLYVPGSSTWFLSANSELVGLWMVAPFSGDFLIALNNVPIVFLWAIAAFQLLRASGLAGAWCHLAALGTLLVHSLRHQVMDASNDLAVVAFFLAGCCYTLRYFQKQTLGPNGRLLAVCIGMVAGVKYFALGYAAVLAGSFCACLWFCRRFRIKRVRQDMPSYGLSHFVWAVGLAGLLGGYWYLRNWIYGGSPLYPMGVTSGGEDSLGYPNLWQTTFVGNRDPLVIDLLLEAVWRMTGSWHFAAFTLTPAMIICFLYLASGRGTSGHGIELGSELNQPPAIKVAHFLLLLWLVGSAAVLIVTPFTLEDQPGTLNHLRWAYTPARYGLCYLSIASIGLAVAIHRIAMSFSRRTATRHDLESIKDELNELNTPTTLPGRNVAGGIGVLVIAGLVFWQLRHRFEMGNWEFGQVETLLLGLNIGLVAVIGVLLLSSNRFLVKTLAIGGCFVGFAIGVGFLSQRWHHDFDNYFDRKFRSNVFVNLNDPEKRERVLVLDSRPYPFFGSYRQNFVINPRRLTSGKALLQIVDAEQIDLVAIQEDDRRPIYFYRGIIATIRQLNNRFEPINEHGSWLCFRVKPQP